MKSPLYYESHVTIEPVFDERLEQLKELCVRYQFHVADLLFQKRKFDKPSRSKDDTFCTSRDMDLDQLTTRTWDVVVALQDNDFQVWRYKIEAALVDSKIEDTMHLIG